MVYIDPIHKVRMNVYLDPKQKAGLEAFSSKTGAPVAELVRRAIDGYLSAQLKQRQGRKP